MLQLPHFLLAALYAVTGVGVDGRNLTPQHYTFNSCVHGYWVSGMCVCDPCWEGDDCRHYVDNYSPQFLVHEATVVLSPNQTGEIYQAWTTDEDLGLTCPLGPGDSARCPCAVVRYHLLTPPGDTAPFTLDQDTGILTRDPDKALTPATTYIYRILVHGVGGRHHHHHHQHDLLHLKVYVTDHHQHKIPWT